MGIMQSSTSLDRNDRALSPRTTSAGTAPEVQNLRRLSSLTTGPFCKVGHAVEIIGEIE
jgi:hypothetical protein